MKKAKPKFHHPAEDEFDFDALIAALATARAETEKFGAACGVRNPAVEEAQALIERIDMVARLLRVPDAAGRVRQLDLGH